MNLFDIIGPVMIGPSSSHTAGAVQIGRITGALLGEAPEQAVVRFYGSFARTYHGHGTDKAVIGGLLGMAMDDEHIKESFGIAEERKLEVVFEREDDPGTRHPNSMRIQLKGVSGKTVTVAGASVGGGNIVITDVDDYPVSFTGEYYTLIVTHRDTPGMVSKVTSVLAGCALNIAQMKVYRADRGGSAIMMIETDQSISPDVIQSINSLPEVFGSMTAEKL